MQRIRRLAASTANEGAGSYRPSRKHNIYGIAHRARASGRSADCEATHGCCRRQNLANRAAAASRRW